MIGRVLIKSVIVFVGHSLTPDCYRMRSGACILLAIFQIFRIADLQLGSGDIQQQVVKPLVISWQPALANIVGQRLFVGVAFVSG